MLGVVAPFAMPLGLASLGVSVATPVKGRIASIILADFQSLRPANQSCEEKPLKECQPPVFGDRTLYGIVILDPDEFLGLVVLAILTHFILPAGNYSPFKHSTTQMLERGGETDSPPLNSKN